jgi:Fe2+ transport system protein FeoA
VRVEVVEKQPFNGPLILDIAGTRHSVGRELAGHVFVDRCGDCEAKEAVR